MLQAAGLWAPVLPQAWPGPRAHHPCLLRLQVVLPGWLSSTKVSSLIERISDPKDLKKLLRTRNNVLVLYSKSGECPAWGHLLGMVCDRKGMRGGRGGRRRPQGQKPVREGPRDTVFVGFPQARETAGARRGVSSADLGSLSDRSLPFYKCFLEKASLPQEKA